MRCNIGQQKIDVLQLKLDVLIAQGVDKIANLDDPRYLEYITILEMFKVVLTSSDKSTNKRRTKVKNE